MPRSYSTCPSVSRLLSLARPAPLTPEAAMPRSKAPPPVKGPCSERGGTRFRIRICEAVGHRALYFLTRKEALTGIEEATRELPAAAKGRSLDMVLDTYVQNAVCSDNATRRVAERRMKKVLFICSQNKLRSPTAEQVFSSWPGVETDSAGLSPDAITPLSSEQLEWASIVFVMDASHKNKLSRKFRDSLKNKRVICLDIPDEYEFMQPELVELLEIKVGRYLRDA